MALMALRNTGRLLFNTLGVHKHMIHTFGGHAASLWKTDLGMVVLRGLKSVVMKASIPGTTAALALKQGGGRRIL